MYYVITSHYNEDTLLDQSGGKLLEIPKGYPQAACSYKTLEAAKKAHPDKPIMNEESYRRHLALYSDLINRYSQAHTETEEFKQKYKKRLFGGYKKLEPKRK